MCFLSGTIFSRFEQQFGKKKQAEFSQICLRLSKNGRVNLMERTSLKSF